MWQLQTRCNLEGRLTSRESFSAVLVNFILRMRTNCYFRASNQNSDIAVRFSDPNFSKGSNNFSNRRRFHVVTFTFDIWPWTFVLHRVSRNQTLYQIWPKSNNPRRSYWWFLDTFPLSFRHAVTLTFDHLTSNVCYRSGIMWSDSVPNFTKIGQSAAELLIM